MWTDTAFTEFNKLISIYNPDQLKIFTQFLAHLSSDLEEAHRMGGPGMCDRWSNSTKSYFDELIETMNINYLPELFMLISELSYNGTIFCDERYDKALCDMMNEMYIDALENHNTEMLDMFRNKIDYEHFYDFFDSYLYRRYAKIPYIMSALFCSEHYDTKQILFCDDCFDVYDMEYYMRELYRENNNNCRTLYYFLMFGCNFMEMRGKPTDKHYYQAYKHFI